jgi:hypothetical protein
MECTALLHIAAVTCAVLIKKFLANFCCTKYKLLWDNYCRILLLNNSSSRRGVSVDEYGLVEMFRALIILFIDNLKFCFKQQRKTFCKVL